jgi:hypothetical protein
VLQQTEQEFHRMVAMERVRRVAQIQDILNRTKGEEEEEKRID